MSGVDINAIQEAIAAQIAAHLPGVHVRAFDDGDSVNYPLITVTHGSGPAGAFVEYQRTHGPTAIMFLHFLLVVEVTATERESIYRSMNALLGTMSESLFDAFMQPASTDGNALSLSGLVESATALSASTPTQTTNGATPVLVSTVPVMIIARR